MRESGENGWEKGATVVITHRVIADAQEKYEGFLHEIAPLCKAAAGHLDWHIVRPLPNLTETYTVIIRFDSEANLRQWMESTDRKRLIARVRPMLVRGDDFFVSSGLDFWFAPHDGKILIPVRWKQYLVTWSAIYPLALLVPHLVQPMFVKTGTQQSTWLTTLVVTAIVVWLMVYVVMPRYTNLLRGWLFR